MLIPLFKNVLTYIRNAIVIELSHGGQLKAERELGWNRGTIRKGISEVISGVPQVDNYHGRGRKKVEWYLPS